MPRIVIVVSSDPVTLPVVSDLIRTWGWDCEPIRPSQWSRVIQHIQTGSIVTVLLDARTDAASVFGAASTIQSQTDRHLSMALICDRFNKDRVDDLLRLGVDRIFLSEHFVPSALQEYLENVAESGGDTDVTVVGNIVQKLTGTAGASPREAVAPASDEPGTDDKSDKHDPKTEQAKAGTEDAETETGESAESSSGVDLKWDGLYNDHGLLTSQARGGPGQPPNGDEIAATLPPIPRLMSRAEAESHVRKYTEAKPLKQNVQLALKYCRDAQASVEDITNVLRQDQALSARVLTLANSPTYRRGRPITTVEQAAIRIGIDGVREAITVSAVMDQMGDEVSDVVNPTLLWEHSFAVATIISDLARSTGLVPSNDAFMIGLLHDMGRAAMFDTLGEKYAHALRLSRERNQSPHFIEKSLFELNHADVADIVFKTWNLDPEVVDPIANHHLSMENLRQINPKSVVTVRLLTLADRLSHAALLGDSGHDWVGDLETSIEQRKMPPGMQWTCVQRAERAAEDVRAAIATVNQGVKGVSQRELMQGQIAHNFVPAFLNTSLPFTDAAELLATQLGRSGDRPNIIVVRYRGDANWLRKGVLETDQRVADGDENAPPLPAIVVGDAEYPPEGLLDDREVQTLRMPFRVVHFISAANHLLKAEKAEKAE